jgi:ubiquinone/menaquinone biosynthesis C-methylase UbiE
VRDRLRALLSRLHLLPALNEQPGDTVVTIGAGTSVSELAERISPEGDLLVIEDAVDELERLRGETRAPNVSYLIGALQILPLLDSSVDEVLATAVVRPDAAAECFRVLRSGGRLVLAALDEDAHEETLNLDADELERLFVRAGFSAVSVAAEPGRVAVLARKP